MTVRHAVAHWLRRMAYRIDDQEPAPLNVTLSLATDATYDLSGVGYPPSTANGRY